MWRLNDNIESLAMSARYMPVPYEYIDMPFSLMLRNSDIAHTERMCPPLYRAARYHMSYNCSDCSVSRLSADNQESELRVPALA